MLLVEVEALLGRLQIPTLKVALLDKSFFSSKSHPARRLLDDVAHLELNGHILIPLQNIASLHCSSRCDAPEPDWPPRGLDEDEQPDEG